MLVEDDSKNYINIVESSNASKNNLINTVPTKNIEYYHYFINIVKSYYIVRDYNNAEFLSSILFTDFPTYELLYYQASSLLSLNEYNKAYNILKIDINRLISLSVNKHVINIINDNCYCENTNILFVNLNIYLLSEVCFKIKRYEEAELNIVFYLKQFLGNKINNQYYNQVFSILDVEEYINNNNNNNIIDVLNYIPNKTTGFLLLAKIYQNMFKLKEAIICYKIILKYDKLNMTAFNSLAELDNKILEQNLNDDFSNKLIANLLNLCNNIAICSNYYNTNTNINFNANCINNPNTYNSPKSINKVANTIHHYNNTTLNNNFTPVKIKKTDNINDSNKEYYNKENKILINSYKKRKKLSNFKYSNSTSKEPIEVKEDIIIEDSNNIVSINNNNNNNNNNYNYTLNFNNLSNISNNINNCNKQSNLCSNKLNHYDNISSSLDTNKNNSNFFNFNNYSNQNTNTMSNHFINNKKILFTSSSVNKNIQIDESKSSYIKTNAFNDSCTPFDNSNNINNLSSKFVCNNVNNLFADSISNNKDINIKNNIFSNINLNASKYTKINTSNNSNLNNLICNNIANSKIYTVSSNSIPIIDKEDKNMFLNKDETINNSNILNQNSVLNNIIDTLSQIIMFYQQLIYCSSYSITHTYLLINKEVSKSKYLEIHLNNSYVIKKLALLHLSISDYEASISYFNKYISNNPYCIDCLDKYSTCLYMKNDLDSLVKLSERVLNLSKDSAESWCVLGNSNSLNNNINNAILFFERASNLNPIEPYYYYLLSLEYLSLKDNQKADELLNKAISINQNYYYAWFSKAKMQNKTNNYINNIQKSVKYINTAINIIQNPNYILYLYNVEINNCIKNNELLKVFKISYNNLLNKGFDYLQAIASILKEYQEINKIIQYQNLNGISMNYIQDLLLNVVYIKAEILFNNKDYKNCILELNSISNKIYYKANITKNKSSSNKLSKICEFYYLLTKSYAVIMDIDNTEKSISILEYYIKNSKNKDNYTKLIENIRENIYNNKN